jgi:membrane-associated phospholipid phosphatase
MAGNDASAEMELGAVEQGSQSLVPEDLQSMSTKRNGKGNETSDDSSVVDLEEQQTVFDFRILGKGFRVKRVKEWNVWNIKWKDMFRRQDHAGLILIVVFYVATGIIAFVADPRVNDFYIYDGTISYPPANKRGFSPTVPAWVSIFIPLLLGIVTLVLGELYYSRNEHHCLTDALAVILYFLLDLAQAVGCNMLVTEATKVAIGRYRPDFLARCEPVQPETITLEYGNNTIGMYPCTSTDTDTIDDGRKSFPSGHASFSFTLSVYAAGYMIWCWNMRREWSPRSRGPWKEFLSDLGNVIAKVWTIIILGVAWGISCTRITDYQHNVSDVVAGVVIGTIIATIFLLRAIPRYSRVLSYIPVKSKGPSYKPAKQVAAN